VEKGKAQKPTPENLKQEKGFQSAKKKMDEEDRGLGESDLRLRGGGS